MTTPHPMGPTGLLEALLDHVDAHVYAKDAEGRYLYVNRRVCELYALPATAILGHTDAQLLPAETAQALSRIDTRVVQGQERQACEERITDAQGKEHQYWSIKVPVQLGDDATCIVGFSTDVTELLSLRRDIEQQRHTDPLTGLGNRARFENDLDADLAKLDRRKGQAAVVMLDIDQFKFINTSLGAASGDAVIALMARRLRQQSGLDGRVARLSGNAFGFRLTEECTPAEVSATVERLRAIVAQPLEIEGRSLQLTASAGIALWPEDGTTVATLLNRAEAAMYAAKDRGRDRARFYSREMGESARLRLELERDLRAAVAHGDFELHYQPKVRCTDGGFDGFEALVRWRHATRGLVPPGQFIPLTEQLGLVGPLGQWVMTEACRQMAEWTREGLGDINVAVNLSPGQLLDPRLASDVEALLQTHGLGKGRLELEVTESMMMEEPKQAISSLKALRDAGVRLSIDDFGTGYSSMSHLKHLPVSTLKLDRVFVQHIDSDRRDADICAGMIALAHKLGLGVVAEGVETEAQAKVLKDHDCDLFQGFLFSRPLPGAKAGDYLRGRAAAH